MRRREACHRGQTLARLVAEGRNQPSLVQRMILAFTVKRPSGPSIQNATSESSLNERRERTIIPEAETLTMSPSSHVAISHRIRPWRRRLSG